MVPFAMSPLVVAVVDSAKACWLTTVTLVVMQMSPLAVASAISVAGGDVGRVGNSARGVHGWTPVVQVIRA